MTAKQANLINETQSQQASQNQPTGTGRDDRAERGRPTGSDGPDGSFPPWYSPHTGTNLQNVLMEHEKQRQQKRVKIYPSGIQIEAVKNPFTMDVPAVGCINDEDNKRGTIEGFSSEAARRLREHFMKQKVEGFELWAVTLTTHKNFHDDWRPLMKRFRTYLKRRGWAGCWRVELQKRKAPHLHVAFWLPLSVTLADVSALWLQCTGEENDQAAREHAVEGRKIPADETGWAVYMGLHDGKHKEAQLGWKGKQWGIWNREAFTERKAVEFVLSERDHALLLRILRNWDVADRMRRERDAEAWADSEMVAQIRAAHGGRFPSCFKVVPSPVPRPAPRYLHRGNLLRLISEDVSTFVLAAIQSGRIGKPAPVEVTRITSAMLSTFSTSAA